MDNRKGCIFWVCEIIQLRCRNKSRPGDTHHHMWWAFFLIWAVLVSYFFFSLLFFCRHKTTGYTTTTHRYWVLFEKDSQQKYLFFVWWWRWLFWSIFCVAQTIILIVQCRIRILHLNEIISLAMDCRADTKHKCTNLRGFFQKSYLFKYVSFFRLHDGIELIKCFECFKFTVVHFRYVIILVRGPDKLEFWIMSLNNFIAHYTAHINKITLTFLV